MHQTSRSVYKFLASHAGFPRLELVRNCVRLASVYVDKGEFAVAHHLLAAGEAIAAQAAAAQARRQTGPDGTSCAWQRVMLFGDGDPRWYLAAIWHDASQARCLSPKSRQRSALGHCHADHQNVADLTYKRKGAPWSSSRAAR